AQAGGSADAAASAKAACDTLSALISSASFNQDTVRWGGPAGAAPAVPESVKLAEVFSALASRLVEPGNVGGKFATEGDDGQEGLALASSFTIWTMIEMALAEASSGGDDRKLTIPLVSSLREVIRRLTTADLALPEGKRRLESLR